MTNIDAQVEAAARVICFSMTGDWELHSLGLRNMYRHAARAGLLAACPNTALLALAGLPPLEPVTEMTVTSGDNYSHTLRAREPWVEKNESVYAARASVWFTTEAEAVECNRRMVIVRGVEPAKEPSA